VDNRRLGIAAILSGLCFGAFSPCLAVEARAKRRQVFVEYRIVGKNLPPHVTRGSRKVWRYGDKQARVEDSVEADPSQGTLMIIDHPSVYMIHPASKRGQRISDPDPNGVVRLPILLAVKHDSKDLLEIGREGDYFKRHKAVRGDDAVIEGVDCATFSVRKGKMLMTLYVDRVGRVPKRLSVSAPDLEYSIRYLKYEKSQVHTSELFSPPEDILVDDVEEIRTISTPFDDDAPDFPRFVARDIRTKRVSGSRTCWNLPVVLYYFAEAADSADTVMHIAQLTHEFQSKNLCLFPIPLDARPDFMQRLERFEAGLRSRVPMYAVPVADDAVRRPKEGSAVFVIDSLGKIKKLAASTDEERQKVRLAILEAYKKNPLADVVVPSSETLSMSAEPEERRIFPNADELETQLSNRDWDALEQLFAGLRIDKERTDDGKWKLAFAYSLLTGIEPNETEIHRRMMLFEEWAAAEPDAVTPRVALGRLWNRYAWRGRGHAYYNDLSEEQRNLFSERMRRARKVLDEGRRLRQKCPELYVQILGLADVSSADAIAIFNEGRRLEPGYPRLYSATARMLLPKWGGRTGEVEAFLDQVYRDNVGGFGPEMYARTVIELLDQYEFGHSGERIFKDTALSWEMSRKGLVDMVDRYPTETNFNEFAFLACAAGDRNTAQKMFKKVRNDNPAIRWGNRINLARARQWSAEVRQASP
jgi:hypothetical protein